MVRWAHTIKDKEEFLMEMERWKAFKVELTGVVSSGDNQLIRTNSDLLYYSILKLLNHVSSHND